MIVGIGLLTLVPGRVGGSETYARELVRALARTGTLDYRLFLPQLAPEVSAGLPAQVVESYPAHPSTLRRGFAMVTGMLAPGRLRREFGRERLDIVHFPLTTILPYLPTPTVVTVHDLYHEIFPRALPPAEAAWRRLTWRRAISGAQLVIAVSDVVRETLIEHYRLDPDQIRVVHHGVDHEQFRPSAEPRQPFLLFPAHNWPNKNHDRLLDAFRILRLRHPELRLVLTGRGHERRAVPAGVEVHGYVEQDQLVRLYQTAAALVFPSLYEGFGQPLLEAMASGCAVAAAAAGAIPETCGDAARLFDPLSVESIVDAVEDVLTQRDYFADAGLKRAAAFSWERCAKGHEDAYRTLAA